MILIHRDSRDWCNMIAVLESNFDKFWLSGASKYFRQNSFIIAIREDCKFELRSLGKHLYQHISLAVVHYWLYWSDTVKSATRRQRTLSANMRPYKSLVKKGSRRVCEKYTSVIARLTSVGRRSLQIFLSSVVTSDSNPRNVESWRMDFSII